MVLRNLETLDEGKGFLDPSKDGVLSLKRMLAEETLKASILVVFPAQEVRIARRELVKVCVERVDGVCLLKLRLHLIISYR